MTEGSAIKKNPGLIHNTNDGSKTRVRCPAGETEECEFTVGLLQSSAINHFLIAVVMDSMTNAIHRDAP